MNPSQAALASLLPLAVAIPIAGAVVSPLAGRLSGRLPLLISLAAMVGTTAVLALLAPTVFGGTILVHYMGGWRPVAGHALGIAFAADPFGLVYALTCAVVGAVLLQYSLSELGQLGRHELGYFSCLALLLLASLIGTALTGDLFNLFVWFEVAALASYALTAFFLEWPLALEAAFKTLVLTTVASFAVFIAAALLYADHGALNLAQLHLSIQRDGLRTADVVALGLLLAGFGTKAGLVPFHAWLPDAHTAAPGPVSALFSGLMVNLGIVAVARLAFQVYGPGGGIPVLGLAMGIGLVSALGGALLALGQDDLKRLLAYDTVSQMGVMLVGLASGALSGLAGTTYHLVNHALFKALLFLCAGAIIHTTGITDLSEMGGLARRKPALAGAFVVGVLAIAGVPPLNGYVSLSLVHEGLLETHQYGALVVMVAADVVTFAALSRAAWQAFFRPRAEPYEHELPLQPGMTAALSTLGALCVAFGLLPQLLLRRVMAPAAGLLQAEPYAAALLGPARKVATAPVHFAYTSADALVSLALTVVLGGALAWRATTWREPAPVRWLRALHTGSVNDYAAYLVAGIVLVIVVSLLGWSMG
jgi:multicomponent Na+:H+ antiporter subunit D